MRRLISRMILRRGPSMCVHPTCSAGVRSSLRCCPPTISSITKDHDELFKLPPGSGRRVAQSVSQSQNCRTMSHLWHPRTGTTAVPPHLAAAAELLVIDLITQHDPQADPEFASDGNSGFAQSLLGEFSPVEALQVWVSAYCVDGRLAPEKAQQGVALFAQPAESLLTGAGIFARDHPHITGQRFAVLVPRGVA